jgi:hypothetical protein
VDARPDFVRGARLSGQWSIAVPGVDLLDAVPSKLDKSMFFFTKAAPSADGRGIVIERSASRLGGAPLELPPPPRGTGIERRHRAVFVRLDSRDLGAPR